jgi:hypothetical protein
MAANGWALSTTTGADNDAPILTESPRGQVFPARDDPAPVVPHVSVAANRHRWRVHACDVGVVHAADYVLRAARVIPMVRTWCRCMSGGVRTLPGHL